jgi:large subunit ribosomal protein L14
MIQQKTILKVSDNSGAKTVKCIKVLGGFKKKYAGIGDIVVISVQKLRNKLKKNSKVKKKEIYRALVIRTKTYSKSQNKFMNRFRDNSVILINKLGNPIGTRVIGPIPKILNTKKFQKLFSISSGLV